MRNQPQQPKTVAIFGTHTLAEDILARLLEREGYSVRHLAAGPTVLIEESLGGVDLLLLASGLDAEARDATLEASRSTQNTAVIPVLRFSDALKVALLDELSASAFWHNLFEELIEQIGSALARAAAGVRPLVNGCG